MAYHVKDFIADTATIERAELLIEVIDLLDSIDYKDHIEKLEEVLMRIDDYPPSDSLNLMESILIDSLSYANVYYGLYLNDSDSNLYTLNNLKIITEGMLDIICDESRSLVSDTETDFNDAEYIINLLNDITDLDYSTISTLIEEIDSSLVDSIRDEEGETLSSNIKNSYLINKRLNRYNLKQKIVFFKSTFSNLNLGFDFINALKLLKDNLKEIKEIEQRTIEYLFLLLASNVSDDNLDSYLNETIDNIGNDDDEISKLRLISTRILKGL